ncbi:unnamed protein product, partial [marine sediment metagenome]
TREEIYKLKKRKEPYKHLFEVIKGEEDLLVLPLVLSIPLNETVKNLVFYGQPPITDSKRQIPEGIVMVDVEIRIKKVVRQFVSLMNEF